MVDVFHDCVRGRIDADIRRPNDDHGCHRRWIVFRIHLHAGPPHVPQDVGAAGGNIVRDLQSRVHGHVHRVDRICRVASGSIGTVPGKNRLLWRGVFHVDMGIHLAGVHAPVFVRICMGPGFDAWSSENGKSQKGIRGCCYSLKSQKGVTRCCYS